MMITGVLASTESDLSSLRTLHPSSLGRWISSRVAAGRAPLAREAQRSHAVGGDEYLEALRLELPAHQMLNQLVVIDDEDRRSGLYLHGGHVVRAVSAAGAGARVERAGEREVDDVPAPHDAGDLRPTAELALERRDDREPETGPPHPPRV